MEQNQLRRHDRARTTDPELDGTEQDGCHAQEDRQANGAQACTRKSLPTDGGKMVPCGGKKFHLGTREFGSGDFLIHHNRQLSQ